MHELKFTRDDRAFLKQIHIDPQPSDIETVMDLVTGHPQYMPNTVIISAEIAKEITKLYGELNMENFMKWRYSGR